MTRVLSETTCGKVKRKSFSKIKDAIELPYLVKIQKDSYDAFIREGIGEVLEDFSPITDYSDRFELYFLDHTLSGSPKYDEKECRERDATYALPLKVKVLNRIEYVICCVGAFASRFNLSNAQAYAYLRRFTGIDFLLDCYEAEHTLSIDDAVEDLTHICLQKGGRIA